MPGVSRELGLGEGAIPWGARSEQRVRGLLKELNSGEEGIPRRKREKIPEIPKKFWEEDRRWGEGNGHN